MSSAEALYTLFASLFSDEEFRIWIRYGADGEKLSLLLPGSSASRLQLFSAGADALIRHGHINRGLFARLLADFPERGQDIRRAAQVVGIRIASSDKASAPVRPIRKRGTSDQHPEKMIIIAYNSSFNFSRKIPTHPTATVGDLARRLRSIITRSKAVPSMHGFDFQITLAYQDQARNVNARLNEIGVQDGHSLHVLISVRPHIAGTSWEPKTLLFADGTSHPELLEKIIRAKLFEILKSEIQE